MTLARCFTCLLLLVGVGPLFGQYAPPIQTREPPFAEEEPAVKTAGGKFDPDETNVIKPAQFVGGVVPKKMPLAETPVPLPSPILGNGLVTIGGNEVVMPAGELPTPLVVLNIEGSDAAPTEQPIVYKLIVRNISRAKAHNVTLRVTPPKNADKVKAEPPPTADDAEMRWEFKTLEAGQTRTVEVAYKPKVDVEEIKILARVQFDFGRGMITHVSPPTLSIKKEGPENLVLNDVGNYRITVKNTGKVPVKELVVKEKLEKGLES